MQATLNFQATAAALEPTTCIAHRSFENDDTECGIPLSYKHSTANTPNANQKNKAARWLSSAQNLDKTMMPHQTQQVCYDKQKIIALKIRH